MINKIEEFPEQIAYIEGMVTALCSICTTPMASNIMEDIHTGLEELKDDVLALWNKKKKANENH